MLEPVSKTAMRRIIKRLDKAAHLQIHFTSRRELNGRGDYGVTETFYHNGQPFLAISIDGGRSDVRFSFDHQLAAALGL